MVDEAFRHGDLGLEKERNEMEGKGKEMKGAREANKVGTTG